MRASPLAGSPQGYPPPVRLPMGLYPRLAESVLRSAEGLTWIGESRRQGQ